jgi:type I restriction enzyme S subunit
VTEYLILKLSEVCHVYQPETISMKSLPADGIYPVYGANGKIGFNDEFNHEEPQLLLGCRGSVGSIHISEPFSWINGNAMVVKPFEHLVTRDYLMYALLGGINIVDAISGTAQPQITRVSISPIKIPVPTLGKQAQIVEKLDKAFAEIDLLERNLELSEENANELSRSFLSSMFAQSNHLGSPEDSSTNRGRAENLFKLSEIFRVGSSKRVLKADWKESGIPFYRGREITRLSKTGIADNELFISESHFKELSSNYGVPIVGDIMITAIGTIGNTYIVKESDCFYFKDASVLWLHKQSDVNSHFIDYWLKSDLFFEQLDKGNGATVDTLTIEKLSNVKILLPSREKQIEVVEKLDRAFEEIELLKEQIKMKKDHVAALRQSLLSSAFSQEEAVA